MRKLLIILLIAIVACSTVEEFDTDDFLLEKINFDPKAFIEAWKKVKDVILKAIKFLKDNGFYEPIVNFLQQKAKPKAMKFCVEKIKDEGICTSIVNFVFKFVK